MSLVQGTTEWHDVRKKHLGASDAPIIMKVSPWKTPYELWENKTGLVKAEFTGNFQTERGNNLEEIARQHYTLETGLEAKPLVVFHPEHKFLMASLDGFNAENNLVVEIKCPGKEAHDLAKQGKVPEYYFPQLQHQMLCANANVAHYYSFDGTDGHLVFVHRDSVYINDNLLPSLWAFWNDVVTKTPPELTDKDYKKTSSPELKALVARYFEIDTQASALDKEREQLKEQIFAQADHPRLAIGRARVVTSYRAGAVDYQKIPELSGVDLDKFRKSPIKVRSIRMTKSDD